ncbi:MAG: hypothetical protein QM775_02885 [Pirellulales bacterium]
MNFRHGQWFAALVIVVCTMQVGCKKSTPGVPDAQQAIFDEIKALGGLPGFDAAAPDVGITAVNLSGTAADDAFVGKLVALPNLAELNLDNTKVTDASAAHVKKMKNLKMLSINSPKIVVSSDVQEIEDGKKMRTNSATVAAMFSQAAYNSLRQAMPDLQIIGVDPSWETPTEPN